jgi:membrane protein YqaA with SNARE-associated domain
MSEIASLWALFGTAFLSATVLPFPSEGALIAFERVFPKAIAFAVIVATIGNTLGGLSTYCVGRFSRHFLEKRGKSAPQVLEKMRRYGAVTLLASWVPFIGDALCGMAGYLRLSWWKCTLWMVVGKGLRYAVIAGVYAKVFA